MERIVVRLMVVIAFVLAGNSIAAAKGLLTNDALRFLEERGYQDEPTDSVQALKWDKIPVYSAKVYTVTDDEGNPLLNEDGTPIKRVFLVDQFGNKRSAEAVKEQQKKISKAVNNIVLKVGGGALLGAVTGLLSGGKNKAKDAAIGAGVGAAAGALLSADDIKEARKQKKSLKEQEKLIAEYQKFFTDEGTPVDASLDIADVKGLDLSGDPLSQSAESLKAELESEEFNSSDDDAWTV